MDAHSREMSTGNAAKIAGALVGIAFQYQIPVSTVVEQWAEALPHVADALIKVTEEAAEAAPPPFNPVASLQNNFPGSQLQQTAPGVVPGLPAQPTVVAPPAAAPSPFPAQPVFQQQAAAPAPAPIPGVAAPGAGDPETAEAWTVFFNDLAAGTWASNWEDNRATKKSASSPDFKHRSWKRPGSKYNVSLYVDGRKNPADIQQRLRAAGVIA